MARPLPHVDPRRRRGAFYRALAAFSATAVGRFVSQRIAWRLDPWVMRATGGRVRLAFPLPTALLETRGARTGELRRNAVLYFHDPDADGERVIVVASKAGAPRHPAWFHNLVANPDVVFGGSAMRSAVVADGAERDRLWALADRVFPPYVQYRDQAGAAGRVIPLVALTPR